MKNFIKSSIFGLFLVCFGIISSYVNAEDYTVNFVTNGGGTVSYQTVSGGNSLDTSLISVSKDGYTFSGWYTESGFVNQFDVENDSVTSDLTLYAKWREHKITVYYHPNGGVNGNNGNPVSDPLPYVGSLGVQYLYYNGTNWNGTNAAPDYTSNTATWWLKKRGYVGHTWWLVGSLDSDIKLPTTVKFSKNRKVAETIGRLEEFKAGDIEMHLYADWTLANYTLTYSGLEGCTFLDGDNPMTYTMLSGDITLNNPSKTGYTFLGRSGTNIEGLSTNVVISGDSVGNRVFEAVWQVNSYSITFDLGGGNKIIVTGDYDSDVVVPQNPEKNGYKFLGWDREIPDKMPADDIVVAAKWDELGFSGYGSRGNSSTSGKDDGKDSEKDNSNNDDEKSGISSSLKDNGDTDYDNDLESANTDNLGSGKIDLDDLMSVYLWALDNGITTGKSLEAALPDGYIKRGEMAKLVVDFVENVLGREVPSEIPSQCTRGDEKEWGSTEIGLYAKKSCALGLMGIYMKNFKPNKLLDRAEFGTIVSRILWGEKFNIPNATNDNKYYVKHLNEVKRENLITKIENPQQIKELRKWIWMVLKKIKK